MGVLSHHLKCEMKSPHLESSSIFSRIGVEFWPIFSWFSLRFADFSRDFASKTREFFDKVKGAERTRKNLGKNQRARSSAKWACRGVMWLYGPISGLNVGRWLFGGEFLEGEFFWGHFCSKENRIKIFSEPPKRGRKMGAARKLSKSVENIFDTFWRFLMFFALREKRRKEPKIFLTFFWRFLTFFDVAPFRWPLLRSTEYLTQEFGSKIRASKIHFPEFGPKFGLRSCKIPCAETCPWASLGTKTLPN